MNDLPPPKSERRWYQFSLRALLVLVLLAAIAMSWLAVVLHQARKEKHAVEELHKLGAGVDDWVGWREILLGPDFAPVVQVNFNGNQEIDAALEHLKELTSLEDLDLSRTQIGDAGLEHLIGLTSLESLDLGGTQVTDAGLTHLNELTNLQWLVLTDTQVTDAGLENLKGLTNLRELDLQSTQVTDEGVKKLRQALPNCTIVR